MADSPREDMILSYYRVRQTLGFLGLSLPILLVIGGLLSMGLVAPSISDYYHTVLRDIFVGIMTAIGVFLIAYPGHQRDEGELFSDDRLTTLAGVAALGVGLFPNENRLRPPVIDGGTDKVLEFDSPVQMALGLERAAWAHYGAAILFLFLLGILCLRKFARTGNLRRRRIYQSCGWLILGMTVCTIVASWFKIRGPAGPQALVNGYYLVLWFEAIAIWAFAIAWLTKGRADMLVARVIPSGWRRRRSDPPPPSTP